MKIGRIRKLSEPVWFQPLSTSDLEVCIVPAFARNAVDMFGRQSDPEMRARLICQRVFTAFRNCQEDDGSETPNTLDNRLMLLNSYALEGAIVLKLSELHAEAIAGEAGAASD